MSSLSSLSNLSAIAVRSRALLATVLCVITTTACQQATSASPRQPALSQVERGQYMVTVCGCGDCHTPLKMGPKGPAPDTSRALSGHPEQLVVTAPPALGDGPWMWLGTATNTAFAGPWGTSFAPNLTSDEESGLGIWTEDMFIGALREGKHFGRGRPIMPPMPWPAYSQLTDEDLKAMFAYLKTVPPIVNHVPEWQPPPATSSPGA